MKKPKLLLMPKPTLKNQEDVVRMARGLVARAESGEIQSLCYVAERADDSYESGSSRLENEFSVGDAFGGIQIRAGARND